MSESRLRLDEFTSIEFFVVCDHCHVKAYIGKSARDLASSLDKEMTSRLAAALFSHINHTKYGARVIAAANIPEHYIEDEWREIEIDPNKLEWEDAYQPLVRHLQVDGSYVEHRRHGALGSPECEVCSTHSWTEHLLSVMNG